MLFISRYKYILSSVVFLAAGLYFFADSSSLAENDAAKCEYHGISADICSRCNPELIPEFKAKGDWCSSHNVAESQCELCKFGEVHETDEDDNDYDHADHADLHPETEHDSTDDGNKIISNNPELKRKPEISVFFPENVISCATDEAVLQLASIKTAERTGLTFHRAIAVESSPYIEAPAEIVFDETKTAVVSTIIPSLVSRWLVEPGQRVTKGTLLAKLISPDIPEMKAAYLEAHASWLLAKTHYTRQKGLYKKELISNSDFEISETEFTMAETHLTGKAGMLKSAGLSDNDLQAIINDKIIDQSLNMYSPKDGIVIERIATPGQLLDKGQPLTIIGEPDALWIEAQVREENVQHFSLNDKLDFSSDGNGFKSCTGRIIWISRFLNKETRSVTIRAKIETTSDILHSGEFGRVTIVGGEKSETVIIPKDAVQWEGCCNVVFVRESIDRFRPRKVIIVPGGNGYYNVLDGLEPGEEFVVNGSYLLKTELRKGSIGAGCCGI